MLVDSRTDRLVGVVLGGAYQLVGRIGEGGMGAVYEAHHMRMQKRVAVKLMNRSNSSHHEALARFHREAIVASRLGHPHLVNVMDFGTSEDGQPYLVMEFLEGEDLERRIRRTGRIPLQKAVQIARQTASAVAAVHAKGVVHRDLKPANIFLVQVPGEPDFVKVLDFGVSKIRAARTKLTDASKVVGTPEYMSPEQVSGPSDEVGHRTDQWALACIVWEMLSGQSPFSADDPNALFYQLRNLPPPPLMKLVPNLPQKIEPVLLRALSKRPAERFPSIRAFARALETAAAGSWAEITPMQADPTAVVSWRHVLKLGVVQGKLRRVLGRLWSSWLVFPMKRAALAAAAVAFAFVATGLLLAGGRSRATTTSSAPKVTATSGPLTTQLPATPAAPILEREATTTATMARPPAISPPGHARAGRSRTASPDQTTAKSNPFALPSERDGKRAKGRLGRADSAAAARRSPRLSVDDF